MFLSALILLLFSNAVAYAQYSNQYSRCAINDPTPEQRASVKALEEIEKITKIETSEHICVDTYIHVVTSNASEAISQRQVAAQFKVLNAAFAPHNISFDLKNTTYTTNSKWAGGGDEIGMRRELRQGDYSTLNLYFVDTARLGSTSALGYCTFPSNTTTGSDVFIRDGCVIEAQSVPGGDAAPYNLGGTAIHEVGHWFSLFHTFENGCDAPGDSVADTPAQGEPTSGCPTRKDTCPDIPGYDPVHNYMDYSYDICYEEFTPGQRRRMHNSWATYRRRHGTGYSG
ncbi:metalloprotease MEP1 [Fusarium tjaetaba]|uniref:Metalloprotease MEP1 n=1 Tax=Fusarium tjaetaba TaxID=1567544 RepID=A0A8H5VY45_9HYPO|nr:metalloprotease MEP1 [Fusarium tjaetaba]KAF5638493.1 metalloprotease MEP1 [Fusarium tjaetaba]